MQAEALPVTTESLSASLAVLGGGERIAGVMDVVERLSFVRDLDGVMEVVRTAVRRLTGADGVTFVLRDGDQCHYADEDAISPLWKGMRFPLEACVSGWAMLNRRTVAIEDIYKDPRIPHDAYRLTFVKSMVMVPVRPENPIAAIGAYWAKQRVATPEEIAVIQAVARSTALALTNVQLDESLRDALRRAEAQAAELARASAAKTRFLASASHDLRQPVQSVLLLAGALAPHVNEGGEAHFGHLRHGLDVLKGLLDSLLDVSKIDAGLVSAEVRDIPLAQVLAPIESTFRALAEAKGLEWHVVPSGVSVRTDPLLLTRILHNLVENAVRYTAEGRILVDCRRRSGVVRIEVQDTGIGIPSDQVDEVFGEFYQVGNPERDRDQGLGLGLTIVRKLADLLGHPVAVSSRPGEGSTFSIEVPVAATVPQPAAPVRTERLDGHGRLMVIIDDDVIVRLGLQATFEQWGFTVIATEFGEEAVEQLQAAGREPDLVMADYRLRQRRLGTDAIRCIEAFLGRRVPGIILTGEIGEECDRDAASSGYTLLRKPATSDQLQSAVQKRLAAAAAHDLTPVSE